jgi:ABC-type cobalamin/Fe3+-siderophores transport system ATPase subunit
VLMGRYAGADRWFESAHDRDVAEAAMRRCDCLAFRHRLIGTLSGGERQRVLLAACLAQQPRLLLLDEPSTFLDVDQQVQCFEILGDAVGAGAACLAVTHDINLALRFCTRILVLAGGTVACDLTQAEAVADAAWLKHLSTRLTLEPGPSGARVRYR